MVKSLIFILFFSAHIYSQEFKSIEFTVSNYPKSITLENLALRIGADFNSDFSKAKATYFWLANNIRYFKEKTNFISAPENITYFNEDDLKRKQKTLNNKIVKETFKTKTSLCDGYSYSFSTICNMLGIENEVIKGYSKNTPDKIGRFPKYKNHIWNAFKVNEIWHFVDVTYGSNSIYKEGIWKQKVDFYYFDIDKIKLNLTHYPEKKKWSEYMQQVDLKRYCIEPIYYKKFLASNAELISPKNGTITAHEELKNLVFKFKNLNSIKVHYTYGKSQKGIFTKKYNSKNNVCLITIKKPKKNDYLNIYFDNNLALQYKIVLK